MAAYPLSLMEFVHALLADEHLRGAFAEDPRGTLEAHGLGGLGPADVHDALDLVQDNEITDFHGAPAWDAGPDAEAFGHGGTDAFAADHAAWVGVAEPGVADWTVWSGPAQAGPADPDGPLWADEGFGGGEITDVAGAAPGDDLHHHHG